MNLERFKLKKNIIYALAAFVINSALVFFSYRLIITRSGVDGVGIWSTLFAWTSLIRIGDVGMAGATMRYVAMHEAFGRERVRDYIETGTISNSALFAVLALVGFALLTTFLPELVEARHLQEARAVLPVMFVGLFLSNISGVLVGSMQGLHLGYVGAQLGVASNFLQMVLVFWLVPRLGLVGLGWAQAIQYGTMIVVGWGIVRRKLEITNLLPMSFSKRAFLEMLSFSIKSQIANLANGLFEPTSKILVSHFGGAQVQGIYELSFKTLWLPRSAVISGVTAMIPTLSTLHANDPKQVRPFYNQSVIYSTIAVAIMSIVLVAASPLIAVVWIGKINWLYPEFVTIMALGVMVNSYGAAAYNLGFISGRMRNNVLVNVITLFVMLTVGIIVGLFLPVGFLIATIAGAMGVGAVVIKVLNERLINDV